MITLRADDARFAVPGLDADGDGRVSDAELARGAEALKAALIDTIQVRAGPSLCPATLDRTATEPPDGVRLQATYTCPGAFPHLSVRFGFLHRMPSSHRHFATVHLERGDVDALVVDESAEVEVDLPERGSHGIGSLVRAGIQHILTGADHLAFLVALVLGGSLARSRDGRQSGLLSRTTVLPLVGMLTAFTIGHSASLAVATLWGLAPSTRLVEGAVALSVAYVGAENLVARSVGHRWLLTFPFGLVHGFAFAGGLLPLGVPRAQLPVALLAFNLGVEAGQLVVLALAWPPIAWLAGRRGYRPAALAASGAILVAGLTWFVQRIA
jgi:hypothetical protein